MHPALLVERVAVDRALLVTRPRSCRTRGPSSGCRRDPPCWPCRSSTRRRPSRRRARSASRGSLDQRPVGLERLLVVPVALQQVAGQEEEHLVEARVLRVLLDDGPVERDRLLLQRT